MTTQQIPAFAIIGLAVRTTNENNQAAADIGALWQQFMTEGVLQKIPNRVDDTIYAVYTDYEKDHTKPYTTLLGCRVQHLDEVPEGMKEHLIEGGTYTQFTTQGKLQDNIVYDLWTEIWNMDLDRAYTSDYEVYDHKAQDPENQEVNVYIALR